MHQGLRVSVGQHTNRGRKEINQDFHGLLIPEEPLLGTKGIAVALADGISSSEVSQFASQAAVTGFLYDYYCTAESWSVKHSVQCVMQATNSWLFSQTRQSQYRYDRDKGYVCTFSALVFKSATAHLFHVGDTRVYRLRDEDLEQLTQDHRFWLSGEKSYLARALGIDQHLEIDYLSLAVEAGDIFVLMTDGVYEHVPQEFIAAAILGKADNLDEAAGNLVDEALARGSSDNLTVQIVRIDALPCPGANELFQQLSALPLPPTLEARMSFDGYRIVRPILISHRSHAWLAVDQNSGDAVLIKTPATEHREDPDWMARFLLEEWIARRVDNPHIMKPCALVRKRSYQYIALEYIEGQTLAQWMRDNPQPALETVRDIIGQIAQGLQAFHRLEMLHQDLRPENVLIDRTGTVKIVDFGAVRVAGLDELENPVAPAPIPGTEQYAAPEYFLGQMGTVQSDIYALGAIAYQMLTGTLPYRGAVSRARTAARQRKLVYDPVRTESRAIPAWVDEAIHKAVHLDPRKRYQEVSEFIYDLRYPNREFISKARPPLMARNPLIFWQILSLILAIAFATVLYRLIGIG
ncbi:MAG: bifunctional protein-serine/threonine kinase/phosphatase [Betaproteobacteria bacterium]|nr:bifunctional protein-serine/threonine kinase/phosphatase [Betaproteobacteria bacterium]